MTEQAIIQHAAADRELIVELADALRELVEFSRDQYPLVVMQINGLDSEIDIPFEDQFPIRQALQALRKAEERVS